MLSTTQQVKETFLIGTLNIGLPTVDVCSDGALMYKLYRGYSFHPNCNITESANLTIYQACLAEIPIEELQYDHHPTWATMLLVPFLLNYIMGWYAWYQIDKKKQFTWPACFFGLYPQLRAANIIQEMWRNPEKGLAKKKKFERELMENEVFIEAVPTTFIMMYITSRLGLEKLSARIGIMGATDFNYSSLFFITYVSSTISASLGMAKVLKVIIH